MNTKPEPDDELDVRLKALSAVAHPPALSARVLQRIERSKRRAPLRWALMVASGVSWALGLQLMVSWTAARLVSFVS